MIYLVIKIQIRILFYICIVENILLRFIVYLVFPFLNLIPTIQVLHNGGKYMVGLDGKCFYNCADLRCYIICVFSVDTFCTLFMTAESNFLIDLVHNFVSGFP